LAQQSHRAGRGDVLVASHRRDAIAKYPAQNAPHALRAFKGTGGFDLPQNGERFVRGNLRYRNGANQRIGLGEKPANLVDSHRREAISLALPEPLLRHGFEGIGRGVLGRDSRALFLQRRIDSLSDFILRFVAPDPSIGKAQLGPAADVKSLLLVEKAGPEARELRAVGWITMWSP
jgi:hypothetical protein